MTTQEIIEVIKGLSVLELNDLVKACEEEFGVSAAAGVVVAAAGAEGGAAEEKDEFDVELTSAGASKFKDIKVVREVTGLGLKEAKEAVDNAPKVLKEQASKEDAEAIFRAVDGFGLSRVDFFLEESGRVVFNEINTLPGFTSISMYPMLWKACGLDIPELIDILIDQAMTRYR